MSTNNKVRAAAPEGRLPRFVQWQWGRYCAFINRRDLRCYQSGFMTAEEAHAWAVEKLTSAGLPVDGYQDRPQGGHVGAILRDEVTGKTKIGELVDAARAAKMAELVEVWQCVGCAADYPQAGRPERCTKCGVMAFDRVFVHSQSLEVA